MIVFIVLSLLILTSALGVVLFRNPVYSALCLVTNLLTVAAIFAALDAHFLAVAQVIVYAGAIMVLFIFVIMLLNIKTEGRGSVFGVTFASLLALGFAWVVAKACIDAGGDAGSVVFKHASDPAVTGGTVKALGHELYTRFLFPFEAASVLIIGAILGAVMLAKKTKTVR